LARLSQSGCTRETTGLVNACRFGTDVEQANLNPSQTCACTPMSCEQDGLPRGARCACPLCISPKPHKSRQYTPASPQPPAVRIESAPAALTTLMACRRPGLGRGQSSNVQFWRRLAGREGLTDRPSLGKPAASALALNRAKLTLSGLYAARMLTTYPNDRASATS